MFSRNVLDILYSLDYEKGVKAPMYSPVTPETDAFLPESEVHENVPLNSGHVAFRAQIPRYPSLRIPYVPQLGS